MSELEIVRDSESGTERGRRVRDGERNRKRS